MAVIFCESFDLDTSAATAFVTNRGWTAGGSPARSTASPRTNGNCLFSTSGNSISRSLPTNYVTLIVNFAMRFSTLPSNTTNDLLELLDGASVQLKLTLNTDGTISLANGGGAAIATSASALVVNTWYYVQFQATINNSTGTYNLDVDGASFLSGTATDTQNTANAFVNGVLFRNPTGAGLRLDDIVIADTSGSANNARSSFRAAKIEALFPTGAGTNTGWTPDSGSNFARVNETAPDDDTSYVAASAVGTKDTYAMADMAATAGTIVGVQTMFRARRDDAAARTVCDEIRSGGTDYDGTTQTMTGLYVDYLHVIEQDPATSAPWTISGVNAMEAGVKVVS